MGLVRIYVILFIVLMLVFYLVPYTLYVSAKGFTLFAYWALLTLMWIIMTLLYLRRWV
ncbi:MAG: hypothetical protein QXO98_00675 [Sulfolobales archaeon]